MRICVMGLWHLGTVISACLSSEDNYVIGLDQNSEIISQINQGRLPVFEPGLAELIQKNVEDGKLTYSSNIAETVSSSEILWIAYDTPVDDDDKPDAESVIENVVKVFPYLQNGTLIIISSQVPIGTTRDLENIYRSQYPERDVKFSYLPENLRLGYAISSFVKAERIIAGVRSDIDKERISDLVKRFADAIIWMTVESAEMTKHALNAFLATSVVFINEIASLCEKTGADAIEVEKGLKSDARIGQKAYLRPGGAYAGGTLAREITILRQIGGNHNVQVPLLDGVQGSNDIHKKWTRNKILKLFHSINNLTIAVWGLTYKPDTDTLRRSASVELCRWLNEQGAIVRAHDPSINNLPQDLINIITLCDEPETAINNASLLIIATQWRDYLKVNPDVMISMMAEPKVIDENRFLNELIGGDNRFIYISVGKAFL